MLTIVIMMMIMVLIMIRIRSISLMITMRMILLEIVVPIAAATRTRTTRTIINKARAKGTCSSTYQETDFSSPPQATEAPVTASATRKSVLNLTLF